MQKLLLAVAAAIVLILFSVQGFSRVYALPSSREIIAQTALAEGDAVESALTEIYFSVGVMGLKDATVQSLCDDFGLSADIFSAAYGKYTDGRFGIADVIIVQPAAGMEDEVRSALEKIRESRVNTFKNFDVYNSTEISQNGEIFQRGDYYILLMIDDMDAARAILERHLSV